MNDIRRIARVPILAEIILFIALVCGLVGFNYNLESTNTFLGLILVASFIEMCIILVSIIGALKSNRAMFVIGSSTSVILGFIGILTITISVGTFTHLFLRTILVVFYVMVMFSAILLAIGGFVSSGNNVKSTLFLFTSSIITIFFLVGFIATATVAFLLPKAGYPQEMNMPGFFLAFGILYCFAMLSLVITMLLLSNSKTKKEPTKVTSTINQDESMKIQTLLKYKQLLDDHIITQEDFDRKKRELL